MTDTTPSASGRITIPGPDGLNAEQQAVYDAIKGSKRGEVPDLFMATMQNPALTDRIQALGALLRYDTTLEPRLSELTILLVALHWACPYEWHYHEPEALKGGLDPNIVDALREGRPPTFEHDDEKAIHAYTRELLTNRRVSAESYQRAMTLFGERGVVELTSLIGYYSMIAMTLNEHRVPMPGGAAPRIPDIPV